jgi:WD40 repeat protein
VLSCAHVVNEALGRALAEMASPSEGARIAIDFPFSRNKAPLCGRVVEWRPMGESAGTDLAVLELDREADARPYRLAGGAIRLDHEFWTVGFPVGQDEGMTARGVLRGVTGRGWLIASGDGLPGYFVEGGFSGAPILDVGSNLMLGMAALAAPAERKTAFVIPVDQLELAWPLLARPYKGLLAFRESDSRYFFGRDRYIDELEVKLNKCALVAVVGPSGSGKSSLVRAGLVARLMGKEDWRVITFRPAGLSPDPFFNVADALITSVEGVAPAGAILERQDKVQARAEVLTNKPQQFAGYLKAIGEQDGRPVLIIADQFEELLTAVADLHEADPEQSVQARFIRSLAAVKDVHKAAKCVLTIRADYMGRALEIPGLAELLSDADVKLGPMNARELLEVIEKPAHRLEVKFDDGLASELLIAMGGSPDALPLLEFALTELWGGQSGRVIHRPPDWGGEKNEDILQGPLVRHAERVLVELRDKFDEAMFRRVFLMLVRVDNPARAQQDTRRPRRRSEFEILEWQLIEELSSQDSQARLVTIRAGAAAEDAVAEIAHEALIRQWPRLRGWLAEDRAFRLWLQRVERDAEEWRERAGDKSMLYRGGRLEEARRWRSERLAGDLKAVVNFLAASEKEDEEDRARRHAELDEKLRILAEKADAEAKARVQAEERAAIERRATEEALALRAEADGQRALAEQRLVEAELAQSRVLATFSLQATASGDAMTGMLLGLYGLAYAERGKAANAPGVVPREAIAAIYRALLTNRELAVMHHEGAVVYAAFSPDGRRLVTASRDNTARLWDLGGDNPVATVLEGHQNWVLHAAFSPDGRRLVTASTDKTARLWDLGGERPVATVLEGHQQPVVHAAFSPDSRRLVTASMDNTARLWDLGGERPVAIVLEGHADGVMYAAFNSDGQQLVTASIDKTARLWDLGGERPAATVLEGHQAGVMHAVFSPDRRHLVTASWDKTARLWDLGGERPVATVLEGHRDMVAHTAFSPDGRRLVTASHDNTARLWDLGGEHPVAVTVLEGHQELVAHTVFSPDGRRLVTASWDDTARLWDLGGERPVATVLAGHQGPVAHVAFSPYAERPVATVIAGHQGPVAHAAFSPNGRCLITASLDKTARLWDLGSERPIVTVLEGHQGQVKHAAFSPDGRRLVTTSSDGTARLWDLGGECPVATVLEGHQTEVMHAVFSPDGRRLVTASWKTAWLWDLGGDQPVATVLEGHQNWVVHAAFSPDGRRLVTASWDNTARLWDLGSKRPIATVLDGHQSEVVHAAFSPDGRRLVTASHDKTARLWDLGGKRPVAAVLEGHQNWVLCAALNSDGQRLVTGSADRTARLWDLGGERPIATVLEGHQSWVVHAAFSPDGRRLVTTSHDHTARLWDLSGERPIATVLEGHQSWVVHAVFSPDGRRLVTASRDKTARLWDLGGERPVAIVLDGHHGQVEHAAFSPDGRRLVTASSDSTARLYRLFDSIGELCAIACRSLTRGLSVSQRERFGLAVMAESGSDRNTIPPIEDVLDSNKSAFDPALARVCGRA